MESDSHLGLSDLEERREAEAEMKMSWEEEPRTEFRRIKYLKSRQRNRVAKGLKMQ